MSAAPLQTDQPAAEQARGEQLQPRALEPAEEADPYADLYARGPHWSQFNGTVAALPAKQLLPLPPLRPPSPSEERQEPASPHANGQAPVAAASKDAFDDPHAFGPHWHKMSLQPPPTASSLADEAAQPAPANPRARRAASRRPPATVGRGTQGHALPLPPLPAAGPLQCTFSPGARRDPASEAAAAAGADTASSRSLSAAVMLPSVPGTTDRGSVTMINEEQVASPKLGSFQVMRVCGGLHRAACEACSCSTERSSGPCFRLSSPSCARAGSAGGPAGVVRAAAVTWPSQPSARTARQRVKPTCSCSSTRHQHLSGIWAGVTACGDGVCAPASDAWRPRARQPRPAFVAESQRSSWTPPQPVDQRLGGRH
jgi:hypothetical protein